VGAVPSVTAHPSDPSFAEEMVTITAETQTHGSVDVHALMARWTESRRQATERLLDVYQKSVEQLTDAQVRTARTVDVPAVITIAETQATLSRDVADACVRSVRKLLEL
jgi:hypothetical protein